MATAATAPHRRRVRVAPLTERAGSKVNAAPADVAIRSLRKPRAFSLIAVYEAKTTAEVVEWLGMSPLKAAAMARRTTAAGLTWHLSTAERLSRGRTPFDVFAVVFWSEQCRDWDVRVELPAGGILRINMKAMVELRGEPGIADRPFLVLHSGVLSIR